MNSSNVCLKNGLVYYQEKLQSLDIIINDGKIKEIGVDLKGDNIIDCTNKLITPSFIDVHTHLRTPGFSHKEDIKTGSYAALKGGYSHICAMPNTSPCLDDVENIQANIDLINKESYINVYPFSAISTNLSGVELVDIENISKLKIAGFSDDGKGVQSKELMKQALIQAGYHNKIVSAHCEDETEFVDGMGCITIGKTSQASNLKGISNKSEYALIQRDVEIISEIHGEYNYQYHVCHLSTKESLEIIRQAKKNNYQVSCEVTPHHLISDESIIDVQDSNYKMNPPLRSKEDVNALVDGLNQGVIEVIATDHAPHTTKEKSVDFAYAPFGIIGLELAFSLLNTHLVKTNKVEITTILKCLIDNPARIFKLDNSLKKDNKAYLNIIDLEQEVVYTKDNIQSKSCNTFYLNEKLQGKVETVIFEDCLYNFK